MRRTEPGMLKRTLRWFARHKLAAGAVIVIGVLYALGISAEWIAPYDPLYQDFDASYQPPSSEHWFGTDALGRDYFSRVLFALRTTIGITAATLLVGAGVFAFFLGILAGYKGGWVESAIMRAGEMSSLFPELMFMILISVSIGPRYHSFMDDVVAWQGTETVLDKAPFLLLGALLCAALSYIGARIGSGLLFITGGCLASVLFGAVSLSWLVSVEGFADLLLIFIVLLPFSWYGAALLVRAQVLALREYEFVLAAKVVGASDARIVFHHIFPNVMGLVVYIMSITFGVVAMAEIGLTWLGLGVQPPHASFGTLIFDAGFIRTLATHPHLMLIPAGVVGAFLFAFNLLGDALGASVTLGDKK